MLELKFLHGQEHKQQFLRCRLTHFAFTKTEIIQLQVSSFKNEKIDFFDFHAKERL